MTTTTRSAAKNQEAPSNGARPAAEAEPGSKHKTEPEEHTKPPSPKRTKKDEKESKRENKEQKEKENGSEGGAKKPSPKETESSTSAVQPQGHEDTPSSILEKGIIYFFFRGRVNVDDPSSVSDIARSHIVLRPIEHDAELQTGKGDGDDKGSGGGAPIGDAGNARLLLIPKKTLPQSGRDRWVGFVEKAGASFKQLRDEFLAASGEYETKTAGTRHTPAATPVAEGVYAITSTGRTSHLAYLLTLPGEVGEVQRDLGLKERGSFVVSTKNPEYPGPANARLPKGPEFPKE